MTSAFLDFSKSRGNDLSTPMPELCVPSLQPTYVHTAGRKHSKQAKRRAWYWVPPMRALCLLRLANLKRFAVGLA
jgi:uncharacterized protein (DUF2237 family)